MDNFVVTSRPSLGPGLGPLTGAWLRNRHRNRHRQQEQETRRLEPGPPVAKSRSQLSSDTPYRCCHSDEGCVSFRI